MRYRLQQAVASVVAQRIVDILEIVQIEKHYGHRRSAALRQHERMLNAIAKQIAIGKQGERIVKRQLPQLLLERLSLADVSKIECQTAYGRVVGQIAADNFQHATGRLALYPQLHGTDR